MIIILFAHDFLHILNSPFELFQQLPVDRDEIGKQADRTEQDAQTHEKAGEDQRLNVPTAVAGQVIVEESKTDQKTNPEEKASQDREKPKRPVSDKDSEDRQDLASNVVRDASHQA